MLFLVKYFLMNKERNRIEKLANISKKIDIGTAAMGLVIGGEAGLVIILVSSATYWFADRIEKKK